MAGTCEDDFFNDSILQFLREPTGSKLEELMEGADAFIEEIENRRAPPHFRSSYS